MPDLRPPRSTGDERAVLLQLLQYHRDSMVRKVEDLDDAAAREAYVPSGTTLLWLLRHLADAERLWVLHRFAGEDVELDVDTHDHTDDDAVSTAVALYRATWARVDAVIAASDLDAVCQRVGEGEPANLRWVVAHLLEETARHAGHADIIRELFDGATGR